jgi:hypothetical protein
MEKYYAADPPGSCGPESYIVIRSSGCSATHTHRAETDVVAYTDLSPLTNTQNTV